jgi:hypothetical protein
MLARVASSPPLPRGSGWRPARPLCAGLSLTRLGRLVEPDPGGLVALCRPGAFVRVLDARLIRADARRDISALGDMQHVLPQHDR